MKKTGYIEKLTHELSQDVWRTLIDETPGMEPAVSDAGFDDPIHAYLMNRDDRIGEFIWSEENGEIIVKGELNDVQGIAEQFATRLGGRFMPAL